MDASVTASARDRGGDRDGKAPHRHWTLALCCAEMLLLAGHVLLVHALLPRLRRAYPHGAACCAILLGVVLAASYWGLTAMFRRLRSAQADAEPGAEPAPSAALRRAGPAVVAAAVILVPHAIAPGAGGLVLTAVLAGALGMLDWLYYRSRSGRAISPDAAAAPSAAQADKIDDLRRFARRHGLDNANILLARDAGRASAAQAPTRGGPTFLLTGRLVDLLSPAELRGVFAHEMAHHAMGHSAKAALVSIVRKVTAVMVVAAALAAGEATYPPQWEAIRLAPVVLLSWCVVQVLLGPLVLACHRHQEARAHRRALEMTGDGEAWVSGLRKVASANGSARGPTWWENWLLGDSPSLCEAVGLAERSAAIRRERAAEPSNP